MATTAKRAKAEKKPKFSTRKNNRYFYPQDKHTGEWTEAPPPKQYRLDPLAARVADV